MGAVFADAAQAPLTAIVIDGTAGPAGQVDTPLAEAGRMAMDNARDALIVLDGGGHLAPALPRLG